MKSVMSHNFSQVPVANIPRSSFNRNNGRKATFDAGYLVPVYADFAYPGDTVKCRMTTFARLATPIVPFMDNLYCDSFFFAVPVRLIWENWERFNGAQDNPDDSTDFLTPIMTAPASTGYAIQSLSDYLGIPTGVPELSHVSFWHRSYNLIFNEWFRDQNLQDSVVVDKDNGPDAPGDYVLLRRGKRHDYFTSCLPWPQKGPAVELPLGDYAPIKGRLWDGTENNKIYLRPDSGGGRFTLGQTGSAAAFQAQDIAGTVNAGASLWQQPNQSSGDAAAGFNFADLSEATASTINALRQAFQIQRLYDRDARGGTRFTEIIRSHFGVISPDARLQRPEYLGGGSTPITVHPIAQTSSTDATTPQGNVAGYGVMSASGHGFTKSFTEHCILLGMVSVRADLNYQQGLNRMFSKRTRFEYYWPALSHIGEQAVLNKEIYATNTSTDADVWGYQERYAEYRYKPSVITGLFRSTASGTLDIWHLAQKFTSLPLLNGTFIQDNPPVDRVVATPDEPNMLFDAYFNETWARPMPTYSVPGLIDHF